MLLNSLKRVMYNNRSMVLFSRNYSGKYTLGAGSHISPDGWLEKRNIRVPFEYLTEEDKAKITKSIDRVCENNPEALDELVDKNFVFDQAKGGERTGLEVEVRIECDSNKQIRICKPK